MKYSLEQGATAITLGKGGQKICKVSPLSVIEPGVKLGENCTVEAFSILRSGVILGDGVHVSSHCAIGVSNNLEKESELLIGNGSLIRSHSVIYMGSKIGDFLKTGHGVTIRENSIIGTNVQIGTLSDIQGDCTVGNYSRLHSNVFVAKGSQIGEFVWIFPHVVITNDPIPPSNEHKGATIQDFAVVASMSTLLPGVVIGYGSLIGARSLVTKSIPHEMIAMGSPAKVIKKTSEIKNVKDGLPAYPWPRHFNLGYPEGLLELYETRKREKFGIIPTS